MFPELGTTSRTPHLLLPSELLAQKCSWKGWGGREAAAAALGCVPRASPVLSSVIKLSTAVCVWSVPALGALSSSSAQSCGGRRGAEHPCNGHCLGSARELATITF